MPFLYKFYANGELPVRFVCLVIWVGGFFSYTGVAQATPEELSGGGETAENLVAAGSSPNLPTREVEAETRYQVAQLPSFAPYGGGVANNAAAPPVGFFPNSYSAPAGSPVPWNTAQALPFTPPAGMGSPPGAAGAWVMVWLPYGMPAAPMGGNAGLGVPTNGPLVYYPAWVPQAAVPNPAFGAIPYGAAEPGNWPPGTVPGGNVGANSGYGYAGYAYGIPGQPFNSGAPPLNPAIAQPYGSQPQLYPGQYPPAQIPQGYYPSQIPVNSGFDQPLAVPVAPGNPNSIPALPSPPPVVPPGLPAGFYPGVPSGVAPLAPANALTYPAILPAGAAPAAPGIASPPISAPAVAQSPGLTPPQADLDRQPLSDPSLTLQGLYVLQGDQSSARARVSGAAFLTPTVLVGGALDVVTGDDLTNNDGAQLTELYLAGSLPGVPGLRLRFGQLDLTSYFDRNSFAKDISRDFFNSTFQTNPALIAGANVTASRPAGLVQWAVTDDIAVNAAVFSSSANINDFALDGFAGEVGLRTGNLIVRGTFVSSRDTQFQDTGDRLEAYGVNAELFIPELNAGLFGRYGRLDNASNNFEADTYSFGFNVLDIFADRDRLGVAYGRNLETTPDDGRTPDVLEVFYDFELIPNIRAGFTFQQRDSLSESFAGFRIRGDLDLAPSLSID
ncbi:MAG: carbohydrate porin [Almyronema sp.]